MASMNKVFIMGRLGFDPELRYTPGQVPVVTMRIATTENWSKDGQRQEQTEWHRVIVWNKQAENCAKYLTKGRSVFVEGKIQTRTWEDKTGQKRYTTEINASNVQFLPGNAQQGGLDKGQDFQDSNSFGSLASNSMESMGQNPFGDSSIDLNDVPF